MAWNSADEIHARRCKAHFGQIDVLINNAGVIQTGPLENMIIEDFENAMKIHFWAPLYTMLSVIPDMKARRVGRIVNIASVGGKVSVPHIVPYSASKFALVGLSSGFRHEMKKYGIKVTTINPGLTRSGSNFNIYRLTPLITILNVSLYSLFTIAFLCRINFKRSMS